MSNTYRDIVREAQQAVYAIPAFNYTDIWEFLGIIEAADELKAPVYAASAKVTVDTLGLDVCGAFGKIGYMKTEGGLYNHLDHCTSVARCKEAVDAGYQSVMLDGSRLPLEENIAQVKEVVRYAKRRGIFTEAEVGQILGKSDEGCYQGDQPTATLEECLRMARESGADSLAVGIGNQHGFYTRPPDLDIGLLAKVHRELDIPLVLHGSSGLEDTVVRECIRNGIAKVNVGTEVHYAYRCAVFEAISQEPDGCGITSFMLPAKEAIKEVVRRWIKICGAEGKRHGSINKTENLIRETQKWRYLK